MAVNIGPKIGIDGEAQFRSALNNIIQQQKTLASEAKLVESAYNGQDDAEKKLAKQSEVLSKQIDTQKKRVEMLRTAVGEAAAQYGEGDTKTLKWRQALNEAEAEANRMEKELGELENATDDAGDAAEQAGNSFDVMGKAAEIGKVALTAAAAAAAACGAAILGFAKSSIETGATFDSSMSQVAATMGKSVDDIGELRDFALEMGAATAFSASQAADALNYMALAGYDADTSMQMLPNVLNLAAAGGMELAAASDMITDSQTALGLSLEETTVMVDQMAKASSTTNTSVSQMGDAILTVGGTAKSLSGGTSELSAVLGVLADNSIKGSEAGTHLRNIMLAMTPSTDKAAAAFEQLGLQTYDESGNLRNMEDIFLDLGEAMDGMTDQERTKILNDMFNKTDLAAVNALLATSKDRWIEVDEAIANADGAAEAMSDTQLDNLNGDIQLFQSALEGVQVAVSDKLTPSLREFVQFGTDGLSRLTTAFKEGGLSAAMGEMSSIISDALKQIIQKIPQFLRVGSEVFSAVADGIMGAVPELANTAKMMFNSLILYLRRNLPTLITQGVETLASFSEGLREGAGALIDSALLMVRTLWNGMVEALPALIENVPTIVDNIANIINDNAPKLITTAWDMIKTLAMGLVKSLPVLVANLPKIIKTIVDVITAFQWMNLGKTILKNLAQGVKAMGPQMKTAANNALQSAINFIKNLPSQAVAWGKNIIASLSNGIRSFDISGAVRAVINVISKVLRSLIGKTSGWGKDMVAGLGRGIKNSISSVIGPVKNLADKIKSYLHFSRPDVGPLREYETWMPDFISGLAKGIDANAWRVEDAIGRVAGGMQISVAGSGGAGFNMGGVTINVNAAPGQSESAIAKRVARELDDLYRQKVSLYR